MDITVDKTKDLDCEHCCLAGFCRGAGYEGTQSINGKTYNCVEDRLIYREVKETMDINDLKKSKEMLVWDGDGSIKKRVNVVHVFSDGRCFGEDGLLSDHYEEIKEPEYRPYNFDDDLSELLGVKIKSIETKSLFIIIGVRFDIDCFHIEKEKYSSDELLRTFTLLDGTPLGVKL